MAGHSKFKNIQHRKGAQDKKRAKLFTKLIREIAAAAKIGLPDPDKNPRLRQAIAAARVQNLPKDRIERAVQTAHDPVYTDDYQEMRYEAFLAGGIGFIIEAFTNNKNRTAGEIRALFTKLGGHLGETGSVSFMFSHLGSIKYSKTIDSFDNILAAAIDSSALDVIVEDDCYLIITEIEDFKNAQELLADKYGAPLEAEIIWRANDHIIIDNLEVAERIIKLLDALDDNDDVQQVFGNYIFSEQLEKDSEV